MLRAHAKVNLRLVVLAREDDGYHQIETLFAALELADTIDITRGDPGIRLRAPAGLGPVEQNLVYRAAVAFHEAAGLQAGVDLVLEKSIPVGAGLGGGSSDAATTLLALNAMYDAPLDAGTLHRIGLLLGADVPFFLERAPFALARGRGERLMPLVPPPDAPVLVAVPDTRVSTADAYRALASQRSRGPSPVADPLPAAATLSTWQGIARVACNDFEPIIAERIPVVPRVLEMLRAEGADLARMTGSGSAVFGIFSDAAAMSRAQEAVDTVPGVRTIVTRTAFSLNDMDG